MNKKQKYLIFISILIFLFVTLNPSVFEISPRDIGVYNSYKDYFTSRPMYQYWAVIAVPSIALYYYFKDKDKNKKT